ncbi:MAG: uracil-DNA glycosylase [Balneolales bacterium]
MPDPHTLIDKAIKLLEIEQEVYGAFSVKGIKKSENKKKVTMSFDTSTSDEALNQLSNIKSLVELEDYCKTCEILRTDLTDTNLVMGAGNPNADLMLIGEAPGKQEDLLGEPFVGRSGQLLTKIMEAINFQRNDIYIANILKHRPPDNRDPLPAERLRSLPYLLKQIEIINPKLILCLGRISAQTLLGCKDSMKDMRRIFHPFMDKYELMVTYHPAALLRNPNWKKDTWEDVQLLRKRYDEMGGKP